MLKTCALDYHINILALRIKYIEQIFPMYIAHDNRFPMEAIHIVVYIVFAF